jgi:ketosteroid isomerase-like protein
METPALQPQVSSPSPQSPASSSAQDDLDMLQRLNHEFVRAVNEKNVHWFDVHTTSDFMNSNPDGSLVDRAAFLVQIARGAAVTGITEHDVIIRNLGDLAIIHARTTHRTSTGAGSGRYTDIWVRRDGRWLCVAAQITRVAT